ncbi:GIY-YIG nuclease family protein [Oceanobacillus kimchii]|nr:GIY-YIG nuclease family protein [Oceanobacillus kimchii]
MREEKKVQDEIKKERKKLEKDEKHFTNAFEKYKKQLEEANTEIHIEIEKKMAEIKLQLEKIKKEKEVVDYREQNARAGYVYIISNIGSFGENIYKIGMTRRLEPMERINELGSASVPFNFDVHAMIFSDDAPDLENKLHKAFINKQVNKVNTRKEFFDVTLEEIVEVVENNFDKTVEFTKIAEAEDYRKSLKISEGKIDEGTNVIAS